MEIDNLSTTIDDTLLGDTPGDDGVGSNEIDPITADINKLFGGEDKPSDVPYGDKDPLENDNAPRDPEALLKKLQSERDSFRDKAKNYEQEIKEYKPVVDFVSSLYEDEEARNAFIGELAPNLMKPKDPLVFIQEGLKKEFGEEFTPDNEEAGVFGSKTWLYNERARDLLQEWREKSSKTPSNLKTLADKRRKAQAELLKQSEKEKTEIMTKEKWDENTFNEYAKWVSGVKAKHLTGVWKKIKATKGFNNPPSPGTVPGGKTNVPSQFKTELDKMFGL